MVYVAVIGPGENAIQRCVAEARRAGELVAARGWITLTGGRDAGVMAAAAEGARAGGGLVIGILPDSDRGRAAPTLTASIPTGLGEGRNAVLVTAADAVVACGMSAGTLSEMALALRARRPLAVIAPEDEAVAFLSGFGRDRLHFAAGADEAVQWIAGQLER